MTQHLSLLLPSKLLHMDGNWIFTIIQIQGWIKHPNSNLQQQKKKQFRWFLILDMTRLPKVNGLRLTSSSPFDMDSVSSLVLCPYRRLLFVFWWIYCHLNLFNCHQYHGLKSYANPQGLWKQKGLANKVTLRLCRLSNWNPSKSQ